MATSTPSGKKDQPGSLGPAGQKPTLKDAAAEVIPSFRSLVADCNNFTDCWKLPPDHAYLCLPDGEETFRIFGILQPGVFRTIQWAKHGFKVINVEKARASRADIPGRITQGDVVMPDGLEPKAITEKFKEINIKYTGKEYPQLKGLKGEDDKESVPLVEGHPDIKLPDKLGVYLGVLQIGVHLTVYHVDKNGETHIHVQHRSSKASYPGKLDQTAAGGLQHGESVRKGLSRETGEEYHKSKDISAPVYDGSVVFSMVRPDGAKKLAGTLEISTKACFSLESKEKGPPKAEKGSSEAGPKDPNVGGFEWMSAAEVLLALKGDRFKPNCALVMIKFLIARGLINRDDVVRDIEKNLTTEIVFGLPKNLETYETHKTP